MPGEVCQTIQTGAQALAGKEEYINVKLFEAVDHDRKITGRGMNIIIFDPKADMSTPPYWEHDNTSENATSLVPAGYEVRVIGATVKFS